MYTTTSTVLCGLSLQLQDDSKDSKEQMVTGESGSSIDWWECEKSRALDDDNVSSYHLTTTTTTTTLRLLPLLLKYIVLAV